MKIVTISGALFKPRGMVAQTLAEWRARKTLKAQWLASGKTIYDFGVADLRREAKFYLYQHPEIFEEVAEMIERDPMLKKMDEAWRKRCLPSKGAATGS